MERFNYLINIFNFFLELALHVMGIVKLALIKLDASHAQLIIIRQPMGY